MQNCRFCGLLLPDNADFCGNCGGVINDPAQGAMDLTGPSAGSGLTFDTTPPPSSPSHSIFGNEEAGQQDTDVTIRHIWSEEELVQNIQEAPPPHYYPQPLWRHPTPPRQHPQPTPAPSEHQELHRQHYYPPAVVQHAHRRHTLRLLTASSKLIAGTTMKWIILVVTAIIVIANGAILVVLATPPALSLSGRSTVIAGGTLLLHGKGFFPGGNVTFTLDNGLPVSLINHSPTRAAAYSADRGASSASALQMLLTEQSFPQTASNASVSVSTLGTFDASIRVSTNWSTGLHTIHATESFSSRAAGLSFTIIAAPKLLVQQENLIAGASNCLTITGSGNLIRGWLCTVTLSTDSADLSWSASSTNSSDRFTPSKEVVHPNQPELVSIFITNEPRCSNATFTFVGPTNTVFVSWSCPTH